VTFTIPNAADAEHVSQAQVDTRDFADILAAAATYTGVLSGCSVTAQGTPDMTVAVAAGTVVVAGTAAAVAAGNVTITANASGNPRFDLICVDSAGAKSAVAGTPAASPVFPDPAGKVVLAAVRVPSGIASINAAKIVDKRVMNTLTKLNFGTAGDVNLYRVNASTLGSDSALSVARAAGSTGTISLGFASGGYGMVVGGDTVLYRAAAGQLYTTGSLRADSFLIANNTAGTAGKMVLGYSPTTNAGIELGTDTYLYRSAANALRTDGKFSAVGGIYANDGTANMIHLHSDGGLYFGSAADTVLYRNGASSLVMNGAFHATTFWFPNSTYMQSNADGAVTIYNSASGPQVTLGASMSFANLQVTHGTFDSGGSGNPLRVSVNDATRAYWDANGVGYMSQLNLGTAAYGGGLGAVVPLTVEPHEQDAPADLTRWNTYVGFNPQLRTRIDKDGTFLTRRNAAPADADIASGEMALWLDSTNGAAKLMVKAKQADGTVRTGQVALS